MGCNCGGSEQTWIPRDAEQAPPAQQNPVQDSSYTWNGPQQPAVQPVTDSE
jgi:hypothetical protein